MSSGDRFYQLELRHLHYEGFISYLASRKIS